MCMGDVFEIVLNRDNIHVDSITCQSSRKLEQYLRRLSDGEIIYINNYSDDDSNNNSITIVLLVFLYH